MGRHRRRGWVLRFTRAVASLATICALCVTTSEGAPGERVPKFGADSSSNTHGASPSSFSPPPSSCPSAAKTADHFLLVVSTIDGSVSALDMRTAGDLRWSVKGDDRPLLSSSITNIQVNRDGVSTRLIPSLDGGLYEFDGEDIKAIPMTAESLLSSSLRITDNCVMVGGKEVGSYGVDVSNGQLSYKCTSAGCKDTSEAGSSNGDMLIITRNMQTVRAVDVNSGSEKWNFSVGQHDLMFVRSPKDKPGIEHDDLVPEYVDEDVMVHNCSPHEEEEVVDEEQLKRLVKVVVSDGLIVGLNPDDPSEMAWSRKFSSPVAKAWILHRGKLETLSLFDSQVVPSLSASQPPFPPKHGRTDPMLYVGTHKRQLYVQKQELNPDHCEKKLPWMMGDGEREGVADRRNPRSIPRVTWRPYLSKSMSHTPLFGGNEAPQAPLLGQDKHEYDDNDKSDDDDSHTSLTVWHENYPFDMGYYLYPSCSASVLNLDPDPEEESIMDVLPASLWMWWKEVVIISVLTSLFVHIVYTRLIYKRRLLHRIESNSLDANNSSESLASSDSSPFLLPDKAPSAEFKSRFADEFECIEQMGKGGYGIVFRAKNKVDEQEYAVKRIALPSDAAVKKKMLREVQTLAKLDHVGIVRYFHSWIEDPPPGWQEERDQAFSDFMGLSEGMSPQTDTTLPSTDTPSTSTQPPNGGAARPVRQPPSLLADILPFQTDDIDLQPCLPRSGTGSGEFSLHSNAETSTDESGSFSLGGGDQREAGVEESQNSLSIVFQNSDEELSGVKKTCSGGGCGSALPFNRYKSDKDRLRNNATRNDSSRIDRSGNNSSRNDSSKNDLSRSDRSRSDTSRSDRSRKDRSRSVSNSYESGEDSLSIVFEDSRHGDDRTSPNACEQSRSAILSDSSYGGSLDNTESGEKRTQSSDVHFTLSSHGLSQHSNKKEGGGEGDREKKVQKKTLPKLYLYIQMQLCQLETLKDWLIANTLNRERLVILDIFEQIVSAVDYVHARGHIHRDLKPSNIFFALDSTVKVGDFGLVTAIENQPDVTDPSPTPLPSSTHTAEVGTQLYMSPEQIQKKAYDQKVDIFSLGMIFLELLMPFTTGMERVTTLHNARKGHFPERFCRELPLESELVKQLMSSSPHKRPTTQQILEHQLLKDFTPTPRRVSFRYRTISSSSSHSDPALAL